MASILHSLILFSLITLSLALDLSSGRSNEDVMTLYEKWLVKHHKVYNGLGEKEQRFQIFKDNLKFIDEHNAQNHSYRVGLNEFADITNEEYRMNFCTRTSSIKNKIISSERYAYKIDDSEILPASVDWRWAFGPIKKQGSCGACWAYSVVAAMEAINKIVTGKFVNLSVQELVDCDRKFNKGCKGGFMGHAFEFIIENGGLDSEEDYPNQEREGKCDQAKKNTKVVSIDGYENVTRYNENALKKAMAHQPVTVAFEASGRALQLYQSGVFSGNCGTSLDHGVVVVGYGSENGIDYWLVRNSWGTNWGENGYFKIERNYRYNRGGKCGIAMFPAYPVKHAQNSAITKLADEKIQVLVTSV
ncbi:cysteine proteinase mucunain-like [Vicia villosa]|uniref:cysteine proteinase mucunain-like n=1 Tax=Vicia villosa TaxID=3911 RepID=UPI00273BB218|nr:cysteine proteinase mucunain-like [Vicia villosa]